MNEVVSIAQASATDLATLNFRSFGPREICEALEGKPNVPELLVNTESPQHNAQNAQQNAGLIGVRRELIIVQAHVSIDVVYHSCLRGSDDQGTISTAHSSHKTPI